MFAASSAVEEGSVNASPSLPMKYSARIAIAIALTVVVTGSACAPTIDSRGNLPPPELLAKITTGQSTQDDVLGLIGTPSTTMNYGEEVWHYISSRTESIAFFTPKELDRTVISITFDKAGKVIDISRIGLKDGKVVESVSRETPTAGKEYSVVEQLLGNVGRFSKDAKK